MASGISPVFRAGGRQRAIAAVLSLGCLLVAGRGASLAVQTMPGLVHRLRLAEAQGEPTTAIRLSLASALAALLIAGAAVTLSVLLFALIDGTLVFVDGMGITVDCRLLPKPLARRLGAGRVLWESARQLEKRMFFFVLRAKGAGKHGSEDTVAFLMVDGVDRLVAVIIERSPNLEFFS